MTALPELSLAQMAGQRVIYSYTGLTPPASLLSSIRNGEVGGVIFFSQNISSQAQIASVIAELDRANASPQNPLRSSPLLLMTDQEGGLVRRLPGAPVLPEKQIGESAGPAAQATAAGTGAGQNLAGAGLNVNLAPVLDVYRTPGNFDDQFQRSYSMNPQTVAGLGADFITAQQGTGVAATAKHFPGLGTAAIAQNTDQRPVTLAVPLTALRTIDEYPYQAAIAGRGQARAGVLGDLPGPGPGPAGRAVAGDRRRRAAPAARVHRSHDHRRPQGPARCRSRSAPSGSAPRWQPKPGWT